MSDRPNVTIPDACWVNLKGKSFPLYAGVLSAAHQMGLKSLTTSIVQIPDESNGHMAVVMARAEFEDGRVYEDVGDCSPRNASTTIAAAALRMASTRSKGRVLRDAIGLAQTVAEEMADVDQAQPDLNRTAAAHTPSTPVTAARPEAGSGEAYVCSHPGCGRPLTQAAAELSKHQVGNVLCPNHRKIAERPAA